MAAWGMLINFTSEQLFVKWKTLFKTWKKELFENNCNKFVSSQRQLNLKMIHEKYLANEIRIISLRAFGLRVGRRR